MYNEALAEMLDIATVVLTIWDRREKFVNVFFVHFVQVNQTRHVWLVFITSELILLTACSFVATLTVVGHFVIFAARSQLLRWHAYVVAFTA